MIHYSCDRCKQIIDPDSEVRYIVRLEIQAAVDSDCDADDDDRDHLSELHEILERLDDAESDELTDEVHKRRRFDLCHDCYRQYINNPLAIEAQVLMGFSDN